MDEKVTVVKMDQSQRRMEVTARNLSPYEKTKDISSVRLNMASRKHVFFRHTHTQSPLPLTVAEDSILSMYK